jgi:hypothetical protein
VLKWRKGLDDDVIDNVADTKDGHYDVDNPPWRAPRVRDSNDIFLRATPAPYEEFEPTWLTLLAWPCKRTRHPLLQIAGTAPSVHVGQRD